MRKGRNTGDRGEPLPGNRRQTSRSEREICTAAQGGRLSGKKGRTSDVRRGKKVKNHVKRVSIEVVRNERKGGEVRYGRSEKNARYPLEKEKE